MLLPGVTGVVAVAVVLVSALAFALVGGSIRLWIFNSYTLSPGALHGNINAQVILRLML